MECHKCRCEVTEMSFVPQVESVPEGWQDPDFPPNDESMGPKLTCYCKGSFGVSRFEKQLKIFDPKSHFHDSYRMTLWLWPMFNPDILQQFDVQRSTANIVGFMQAIRQISTALKALNRLNTKNQRAPLSFLPFRFATFTAPNAKLRVIGPASWNTLRPPSFSTTLSPEILFKEC